MEKSPFLCYVERSGLIQMAMWGLRGWCQLPTETTSVQLDACTRDVSLAGHEVSKYQPSASGSELCDMVQSHSPSPIHIHCWWTLEAASPWGRQVGFNLAFLTIGYFESLVSQVLTMTSCCEVQQTLRHGIRNMRVKSQKKKEASFQWHSGFNTARYLEARKIGKCRIA